VRLASETVTPLTYKLAEVGTVELSKVTPAITFGEAVAVTPVVEEALLIADAIAIALALLADEVITVEVPAT
jgi:hypothetical protein